MNLFKGFKGPTAHLLLLLLLFLALAIVNAVDTLSALVATYILRQGYIITTEIRSIAFTGESILATFVLVELLRTVSSGKMDRPRFKLIFSLQFITIFMALVLYVIYGYLPLTAEDRFVTDFMWMLLFVVAATITPIVVMSEVIKGPYKEYSPAFLFVGLAFLLVAVDWLFLWTQNALGARMDIAVVAVARSGRPILFFMAVMSIWLILLTPEGRLSIETFSRIHLRKIELYGALLVGVAPVGWDFYKEGLINLIITTMIGSKFGFSFGGAGILGASFLLMTMIFFIANAIRFHYKYRSERGVWKHFVLLGMISFPLNMSFILFRNFSSIPGITLSLDALIIGYCLKRYGADLIASPPDRP